MTTPTHKLVAYGHFSGSVKAEHPIPRHLMPEALQAALVPSSDPTAIGRYPMSRVEAVKFGKDCLGLGLDVLHTDYVLEPITGGDSA